MMISMHLFLQRLQFIGVQIPRSFLGSESQSMFGVCRSVDKHSQQIIRYFHYKVEHTTKVNGFRALVVLIG